MIPNEPIVDSTWSGWLCYDDVNDTEVLAVGVSPDKAADRTVEFDYNMDPVSVSDKNDDCPPDETVIEVVQLPQLEKRFPDWEEGDVKVSEIIAMCTKDKLKLYGYPAFRLEKREKVL